MNRKLKEIWEKIAGVGHEAQGQTRELLHATALRKAVVVLLVVGLLAGWVLSGVFRGPRDARDSQGPASAQTQIWTCSMHPQIQLPEPGQCPICGMDLIPVEGTGGPASSRGLTMSEDAAKLAEIQTQPAQRRFVAMDIRMVGKVEYDETKVAFITAWTGGRIDRLYIDQTGVPVRKGDHMAQIYSPELLSAQEEYLQALESVEDVKETHLDIIRSTSQTTVENAQQKLKLLGVTEEQIADLTERKITSDHMTIYAPVGGIVVKREVQEGDYVKTGSRIYSIVDLSKVWVKLDAYEADLQWLRYGQEVAFEAEAYPGATFTGRISLIDPILNEATRTVKVRVDVGNEDARLKPGMFVRALVSAQIGQGGKVMDNFLQDKWICPMHPAVVKEGPGACPICEMPLVTTESMGYAPTEQKAPLVVPASAVLKTGKRAVVYVRSEAGAAPTFEGREITLGARAGDYYIVRAGLSEGERVVTQGNFKIDSALQIQAKPSMMNPEGAAAHGGSHGHEGMHGDGS